MGDHYLDPCHHRNDGDGGHHRNDGDGDEDEEVQVGGGEAIKSPRSRRFLHRPHLGQTVRRFQKFSGQGMVAISRRIVE